MVKLVDTTDSKSVSRPAMRVRFSPQAPFLGDKMKKSFFDLVHENGMFTKNEQQHCVNRIKNENKKSFSDRDDVKYIDKALAMLVAAIGLCCFEPLCFICILFLKS